MMLLTRPLNMSCSAAMRIPAARHQSAAVVILQQALITQIVGILIAVFLLLNQFVREVQHGLSLCYHPCKENHPSAGDALSQAMLNFLNKTYLVADEMVSSSYRNGVKCAKMGFEESI